MQQEEAKRRREGESTGAHRIVSRFIAPVVWNNESTEMSNLLALSVHDERRERDARHGGANRIWWYQTRWWYFNPLTQTQFSTVVYLPVACIFIASPKTNFVGAWPLTSDANESCGKTEWRPNSPDIRDATKCGGIGWSVIGRKIKIDCSDLYEKLRRDRRTSNALTGRNLHFPNRKIFSRHWLIKK